MFAAIAALAVAPAVAAAQQNDSASSTGNSANRVITLRGCVTPGVDKGSYVLTHLEEVTEPGQSAMPAQAHGRRVVFWLDHDSDVKRDIGQSVEVRGRLSKFEDSEIELKAGPAKDGGLLAEFEGPGKDVEIPNATVGDAVGTTGRTVPEKKDVKTLLVRVAVDTVLPTGPCH
jgi:hypothetical protein